MDRRQGFPFVRRYGNCAYASDRDFTNISQDDAQRVYRVADGGNPLLNPADAEDAAAVHAMLRVPFISPDRVAN